MAHIRSFSAIHYNKTRFPDLSAVIAPPFDTDFGRMSGLMDPDGAVFWVAQAPEGAPMTDWSD